MTEVFLIFLALFTLMSSLQYLFVIKPTKKRFDIWLSKQYDNDKKGS